MPYTKFLSNAEAEKFESPPDFDSAARKQFFRFPKKIMEIASRANSKINQVCLLVIYGYFKATLFKKDKIKENINRITLLKKFSQSTRPSKIKRNVDYLLQLKSMYHLVEPVLLKLDLNHTGINYYANSVIKSQVFQIAKK